MSGMTFTEAMTALEEGKTKVRRKSWPKGKHLVRLHGFVRLSYMEGYPNYAKYGMWGTETWDPHKDDFLADWETYT